jgi:transcriptional regulator with XRE-family HTH domain
MKWTASTVSAFRDHTGLSQQAFGELLGYSKNGASTRVSELERGTRDVNGMVVRVLDLLAERHGFGSAADEAGPDDLASALDTVAAQVGRIARQIRETGNAGGK